MKICSRQTAKFLISTLTLLRAIKRNRKKKYLRDSRMFYNVLIA